MYSPKAAVLADKMGYENVLTYRQGIIGWAKAGLPLEHDITYPNEEIPLVSSHDLAANKNNHLIIDIRPNDHFIKGHIAGAQNIDLEDLHERYGEITGQESIVLVDHKGKLTLTTGRYLFSKGIRNVFRLDGGFNAWVKEGYQISR